MKICNPLIISACLFKSALKAF